MEQHGSRLRFVKRIPGSALAPTFKLSLPHSLIQRDPESWLDQDFELATSASSSQYWHGKLAVRRNKDRSEYTLKGRAPLGAGLPACICELQLAVLLQGWKLFSEAHSIELGHVLSFELVGKRMVIQRVQSPSTSPEAEPEQPPRLLGGQDDFKLEQSEGQGPLLTGVAAQTASLAHLGEPVYPPRQPQRSSQQSMSGLPPPEMEESSPPRHTSPPASQAQAEQHLAGLLEGGPSISPQTPVERWTHPNFFAASGPGTGLLQPGLPLQARGQNLSSSETLPSGPSSSRGSDELDLELHNVNMTIRQLQQDAKRFELRAERAEHEEVQLRTVQAEMRSTLLGALQAITGLERVAQQLGNGGAGSGPALEGLQQNSQELLQHAHAIRLAMWRVLSADV